MADMTRRRSGFREHQMRYDIGALEQRVYGLEQGIAGISQQLGALSTKIDERGRPQWMLMVSIAGFLLAFMTAIGTLAYLPIRTSTERLEADMVKLRDSTVTGRELDVRSTRTLTDLARIDRDLTALERSTVPRGEHEEKWRGHDRQVDALQRQIDDIKKSFGDTFSLRDALLQMQRRIDLLEGRRPP